jgi:hypothetical protein
MGRHLAFTAVGRGIAAFVAVAGLIGALGAIALPTGSGPSPEAAAALAVGSLALLAGHAWGLLIVALADLLIVGAVWPLLVFGGRPSSIVVAAAIALAGALPGLVLLGRTLPGTVELVLGENVRWRSAGVAVSGVLCLVSLVLPVF